MSDQKPPRDVLDERETLLMLLNYQRRSLLRKLEGVTDAQSQWSPLPSGTSLRWLVQHLTDAERLWMLNRYAGAVNEPRSRSEITSLEQDCASYTDTWGEVDAVVRSASDLNGRTVRDAGGSPVTLR
jgi:hypothetical protein